MDGDAVAALIQAPEFSNVGAQLKQCGYAHARARAPVVAAKKVEHALRPDHPRLVTSRFSCRVGLMLLLFGSLTVTSRAADPAPTKPSLVLVLTIDQFRGDYLDRFREHLVPGGLKLLVDQGAHFVDCRCAAG